MKPLRIVLAEEIKLRGYAKSTEKSYNTNVGIFIKHIGISPQKLTLDHVRSYKLFMIDSKKSPRTINQTIAAIKFFLSLS